MHPDDVVDFHVRTCSEASAAARQKLNGQIDVAYGEGKAKMDIFLPVMDEIDCGMKRRVEPKAVFVFVHGGYWQDTSKDEYSMLALPITALGAAAITVGYNLAPDATLDNMVDEIQSAVVFIARKFPNCNLYLCGYSAGAQLCAMMMCREWGEDSKVPSVIKGMCLLSGVYQLVPIISTYINEPLKMKKDDAERNSPLLVLQSKVPSIVCPVLLFVGEHESPTFIEMSESLSVVLKGYGIKNSIFVIPKTDHYMNAENLACSDSILMQEIFKLMSLAS